MGRKIQVDELEWRKLQVQDRKISALLEAQKDLCLVLKEFINTWKIQSMERSVEKSNRGNIVIQVKGGCVTEVFGLPSEWTYEVDDQDTLDDGDEFTPIDEMQDVTDSPWERRGDYNGG